MNNNLSSERPQLRIAESCVTRALRAIIGEIATKGGSSENNDMTLGGDIIASTSDFFVIHIKIQYVPVCYNCDQVGLIQSCVDLGGRATCQIYAALLSSILYRRENECISSILTNTGIISSTTDIPTDSYSTTIPL